MKLKLIALGVMLGTSVGCLQAMQKFDGVIRPYTAKDGGDGSFIAEGIVTVEVNGGVASCSLSNFENSLKVKLNDLRTMKADDVFNSLSKKGHISPTKALSYAALFTFRKKILENKNKYQKFRCKSGAVLPYSLSKNNKESLENWLVGLQTMKKSDGVIRSYTAKYCGSDGSVKAKGIVTVEVNDGVASCSLNNFENSLSVKLSDLETMKACDIPKFLPKGRISPTKALSYGALFGFRKKILENKNKQKFTCEPMVSCSLLSSNNKKSQDDWLIGLKAEEKQVLPSRVKLRNFLPRKQKKTEQKKSDEVKACTVKYCKDDGSIKIRGDVFIEFVYSQKHGCRLASCSLNNCKNSFTVRLSDLKKINPPYDVFKSFSKEHISLTKILGYEALSIMLKENAKNGFLERIELEKNLLESNKKRDRFLCTIEKKLEKKWLDALLVGLKADKKQVFPSRRRRNSYSRTYGLREKVLKNKNKKIKNLPSVKTMMSQSFKDYYRQAFNNLPGQSTIDALQRIFSN